MTVALTDEEERFCQLVGADHRTKTSAYTEAYKANESPVSTIQNRASTLAKRADIAERIAVIVKSTSAKARAKPTFSRQDAINEAEDARAKAAAKGMPAAAVAAITLKAKLSGYLVDKTEVTQKSALDGLDMEGLTKVREEVEERIKRQREADELTGVEKVTNTRVLRRVIG